MTESGGTGVRIGDARVRVRGEHPVLSLVLDELGGGPIGPGEITVELRVGAPGDFPDAPPFRRGGPLVTRRGDSLWATLPRTGFVARFGSRSEHAPPRIDVAIHPRPMPWRMPRPLFRWAEPTFMTPEQAQAYVFMLRLMEGAVFLEGCDTVLLHASCIERGGRGVLLAAEGGVGKTTTAATLLRRPGWRYLADDITPLSASGRVFRSRRRAMVYAYNLRDDPGLQARVVEPGGPGGRLQWRVLEALGIDRRRRRVAPEALWGTERMAEEAEADVIAILSRREDGPATGVTVEEGDPAEAAALCRSVMSEEQAALGEIVRALEAAGGDVTSFDAALDRHEHIYRKVFGAARRLVHLRLPAEGDAHGAADAIEALMASDGA